MAESISQETINTLVDRFYEKLTKVQEFSMMFAQRGVDIENLKNRQRVFLHNLANMDTNKDGAQRVNQSHPFHISEERAHIWINTMEETINELDLNETSKAQLINKIQMLLKNLINK